jgi:hypothetical protein
LQAAKLPGNPADLRLELAYDAIFYGGLAMLEASKLELSSDKGHHKELMNHPQRR